ncbi:hypothetical protein B0H13DRAFT_1924461 [Mycena leptocephala]|nr:hypothetical protein B0H13DRAFT_1924461 [Mycena leptocephala]
MTSLPEFEACLPVLPSALPAPGNATPPILVVAAGIMHYASPLCLTRILITAIARVEKIYLEALETDRLQLKISKIREASLRNSVSCSGTLREFFGGRTFALLGCIREVRIFETHIEVSTSSLLHSSAY